MSLSDWLNNGWLAEHETSREEIADLLSVVDRDLADCQLPGLSADWQLSIAYNAALQVALASLAVAGYRVARESHHFRALQSLAMTLGCDSATVAQLEAFRKKRNISDYERAGNVSAQESTEMYQLAKRLRELFSHWLQQKHPQLLS